MDVFSLRTFVALTSHKAIGDAFLAAPAAWVWDETGRRIVWANASGVAFWQAPSIADLLDRHDNQQELMARQITRLLAQVSDRRARLEMLRFAASPGTRVLPCRCQRIAYKDVQDGKTRPGLLCVLPSPITPNPDPGDQIKRFVEFAGAKTPIGFVDAADALIDATPALRRAVKTEHGSTTIGPAFADTLTMYRAPIDAHGVALVCLAPRPPETIVHGSSHTRTGDDRAAKAPQRGWQEKGAGRLQGVSPSRICLSITIDASYARTSTSAGYEAYNIDNSVRAEDPVTAARALADVPTAGSRDTTAGADDHAPRLADALALSRAAMIQRHRGADRLGPLPGPARLPGLPVGLSPVKRPDCVVKRARSDDSVTPPLAAASTMLRHGRCVRDRVEADPRLRSRRVLPEPPDHPSAPGPVLVNHRNTPPLAAASTMLRRGQSVRSRVEADPRLRSRRPLPVTGIDPAAARAPALPSVSEIRQRGHVSRDNARARLNTLKALNKLRSRFLRGDVGDFVGHSTCTTRGADRSGETPYAGMAPPAPSPKPVPSSLDESSRKAFDAIAETLQEVVKETGAPASPIMRSREAETRLSGKPLDADMADISGDADRQRANKAHEQTLTAVLNKLPVAILIYQGDEILHANSTFLHTFEYETIGTFRACGGIARLMRQGLRPALDAAADTPHDVLATTRTDQSIPVSARLHRIPWGNGRAMMLLIQPVLEPPATLPPAVLKVPPAKVDDDCAAIAAARRELDEDAPRPRQEDEPDARLKHWAVTPDELASILDTATDGVLILDQDGQILALNRSAEALFGYDAGELLGLAFTTIIAPQSRRIATDYLQGLVGQDMKSVLNDGREVMGIERRGGLIPLSMTVGPVDGDGRTKKFCAVLRDITQWKQAEQELHSAKARAEAANAQKSDFLAKISHEIRTPLNAIIGFSEVMMEERIGPLGNARYLEYLRDINVSGAHLMSLINDLLDLSKIEAGKLELEFAPINLNDIVNQCVSIMQGQASRERIIVRTGLSSAVPAIVADDRSMRQILLNLLSNAIKFTPAGGQIIITTSREASGDVVTRVRDTGRGMRDEDIEKALQPFAQINSSRSGGNGTGSTRGTGLGLPLTKALIEANRARFVIGSKPTHGTIAEIIFPAALTLAK